MTLYIFATGGTGSKVMKSLIFLLASGVRLKNVDEIVPIIIDPHSDNHDLERTTQLIEAYREIRSTLKNKEGDFFYTPIVSLREKSNNDELPQKFGFQMVGDDEQKIRFKDYIDYSSLEDEERAFTDLLFSKSNLDTVMNIGFVGNPNIGSVVLNQIEESREFSAFASSFQQGDRVFIVSSIFGGTGASAFPILMKNIRSCTQGQQEFIKNSMLGALTVMPYFMVGNPNQENPEIESSAFKTKTKAALNYYLEGVIPFVDRLYGIADRSLFTQEYDPGEKKQEKNIAHFVELIGATAIIDFLEASSKTGSETTPKYLEYGLTTEKEHSEGDLLTFRSLGNYSRSLIQKPLTKLTFMLRHMQYMDQNPGHRPPWMKSENSKLEIDPAFRNGDFYRRLRSFLRLYEEWLNEMSRNRRHFIPFLLDSSPLNQTVNQVPLKKEKLDYNILDYFLSDVAKKTTSYESAEDKFLKVFSTGLDEMISVHY